MDVVTEAHGELDRVSIPRVTDEQVPIGLVGRIKILAERFSGDDGGGVRKALFESGDTVAVTRDFAFGPKGMLGDVTDVFLQGGVWLADVHWSNGEISQGIDCAVLKLFARRDGSPEEVPTSGEVLRKLHSAPTAGEAALLDSTIEQESRPGYELRAMVGPKGVYVGIPSLIDLLDNLRDSVEDVERKVEGDDLSNEEVEAIAEAPEDGDGYLEEVEDAVSTEHATRLITQREEARAGEDRFKAQRDSALELLRWIIGDVIA